MRRGARNDRQYHRRPHEEAALEGQRILAVIGIFLAFQRSARTRRTARAPRPRKQDEAPRRQLAVIGHPDGDGEDFRQLLGRWARLTHGFGGAGFAGLEERKPGGIIVEFHGA